MVISNAGSIDSLEIILYQNFYTLINSIRYYHSFCPPKKCRSDKFREHDSGFSIEIESN
jgi:hypothetical protein